MSNKLNTNFDIDIEMLFNDKIKVFKTRPSIAKAKSLKLKDNKYNKFIHLPIIH